MEKINELEPGSVVDKDDLKDFVYIKEEQKTMDEWLDAQNTIIDMLYSPQGYQHKYDEAELNYDSKLFKAMEDYMKTEGAKATLCEKAAKADQNVQEAKRLVNFYWREVCAARENIKHTQNRYEAEKARLRVVEDTVNKGANIGGVK